MVATKNKSRFYSNFLTSSNVLKIFQTEERYLKNIHAKFQVNPLFRALDIETTASIKIVSRKTLKPV